MHRRHFIVGLALGALSVTAVSAVLVNRYAPDLQASGTPGDTLQTPLVGSTAVPETSIAQRVDFSRKLIQTRSDAGRPAVEATVAALGGSVIDQVDETTYVVKLPEAEVDTATAALEQSDAIANVGTDYPITVTADTIDWGVERITAPTVWPKTTGESVKVAILDTGIDANHPDLQGRVVAQRDFITESEQAIDNHGHGTHVAGTIAALQNDTGYVGAAPGVQLVVAKVLNDEGIGYLSDVIEGIRWAESQGAKVMNFSIGSPYDAPALEDALADAARTGVIHVAAAGNTNGGALNYPARYNSVISVGAVSQTDELASFSAVGADFVAPGVGITSTTPGGSYATWSGTSMAAPHVSGAVALLVANGKTDIPAALSQGATDLGASGTDATYGAGLVNLDASVNGKDTTAPLVTITEPVNGASITGGQLTLKANVTDEIGVTQVDFAVDDTTVKSFTASPYEASVSTATLAAGNHVFTVTGRDEAGNAATVKVAFTTSASADDLPQTPVVEEPADESQDDSNDQSAPAESPRADTDNRSQDVRQDTAPTNPSEAVRQDANAPAKDVAPKTDSSTDDGTPTGTNYGRRGRSEGQSRR